MSEERPDSGGARPALDLTNEKDRGMMRRFMTRHKKRVPGIDPERMRTWLEDLDLAKSAARATIATGGDFYASGQGGAWDTKLDASKVLISAVKTETMMEAMNQSDDHHHDRLDADDGKPPPSLTVNVGIVNNAAAELAKDPEAFRLLAEAAERLQAKPPE
jgi:hypothetical protein